MCKYCVPEDEFNPYITIFESTYDFGKRAEINTKLSMVCPEEGSVYSLNMEAYIGRDLDDCIEDAYIPIKYCPFCGRKLTFSDEEAEK